MNYYYDIIDKAENPSVIKGILDTLYGVESISDAEYDDIVYYAMGVLDRHFGIDVESRAAEQGFDSYAYMLQGLFID